uniref:hypothetical protein n=1 Tax=Citrobacter koseri TaxID=545 RepID=UPI0019549DF0
RLMSATQILAAEVTGYALGQIGALGQAGQAAFGRVMNSGMMFGGIATMLGGAAAGGGLGMAVRGLNAARGVLG